MHLLLNNLTIQQSHAKHQKIRFVIESILWDKITLINQKLAIPVKCNIICVIWLFSVDVIQKIFQLTVIKKFIS